LVSSAHRRHVHAVVDQLLKVGRQRANVEQAQIIELIIVSGMHNVLLSSFAKSWHDAGTIVEMKNEQVLTRVTVTRLQKAGLSVCTTVISP